MARIRRFSRKPRFSRKRRVSQGTWFPNNGVFWSDGESQSYWDSSITDVTPETPNAIWLGPAVSVYSVTPDYTQSGVGIQATQVNARPSLRDFTEGQDWLCKRIVGKLFLGTTPTLGLDSWSDTEYWPRLRVAAGFFVARALDDDQASPDLTAEEIDPFGGLNIQNSWMWRRTWVLDNPNATYPLNTGGAEAILLGLGTISNRDFDMESGPHFDVKSRRRIKREERLWFTIAAQGMGIIPDNSVTAASNLQTRCTFNLDYRIFGKMMKGKPSPTF